MATSTLRPNSTSANTGDVSDGGSAHGRLADDTDAGFVQYQNNESSTLGLGDFTLPRWRAVQEHRGSSALPPDRHWTCVAVCDLDIAGENVIGTVGVTLSTATTLTVLTTNGPYTESEIDAATLKIACISSSPLLVVYEAYVDVTYIPKPEVTSITVGDGSATITDDDSPLISWTWE